MGKGLGKKKKPDFSEVAFRVVREATDKADVTSLSKKSPQAIIPSSTTKSHKAKRPKTS